MSTYAGIGSRDTPADVLDLMSAVADELAHSGWTLRSGHAPGADQAFEVGAGASAEIYLPWPTFEQRVPFHGVTYGRPTSDAASMAASYHPRWGRLSVTGRALHARNCHQVLGRALDAPVKMVVCWTRSGLGGGGTGQALRIALDLGIPVWDLAKPDARAHVTKWLDNPPTP